MTDQTRAILSADDAELLNMVRAGDTAAFRILCQRHERAARRLARDLVVTVADIDDVVAETFAQLLEVTRRGGGPSDAFRPYLLTALRRVCDKRAGTARRASATGDESPAGADETASEAVSESLIVRAFLSLPERWIAVLWHAEIEESSPAEVAPLLGLSPAGCAALRRQAKEGLRRAYLQTYTSGVSRPECTAAAVRLGAFIRDAVSGPDSAMVTEHLSQCDDCRTVFAELSDVSIPLRAMVAPVFLGDSAGYYLSGSTPGSRSGVVTAPLVRRAAGTARGAASSAWRPAGLARSGGRGLRWIAVGSAAAIAVGAAVFAISLAGKGTPLGPAGRDSSAAAALARPSATGARSASGRVPAKASAPGVLPSSPALSPGEPGRPAGMSPSASSSRSPVRLMASVDVSSGNPGHGAMAVFQVSDTGSAKTGRLTVSVVLPAGSRLVSWEPGHGHGHGHGGGNQDGWSCQATSSGATCTHDPIQAGGQSTGTIFIGIGPSTACGQPVSVTVTSGSASASAQSARGLGC